MHGQTWWVHFRNNWQFSMLAVKAAAYTLGHGVTPRVSGRRASEYHNELWDLGRILSIEDLTHRLNNNLYVDRAHALRDYEAHAEIYNESPRLEPFRAVVEAHFATSGDAERDGEGSVNDELGPCAVADRR